MQTGNTGFYRIILRSHSRQYRFSVLQTGTEGLQD